MDKPTDELEWRMQRVRHYLKRLPITHFRAIIFGSVARGDFVKESDTDLLVISEEFPDSVKERIDLLFDLRDEAPEIEPVGWLESEFRRRKRSKDQFVEMLEKEGIEVSW